MADMRKAIDTLLFSGDFTPTTFDLAFFMHTLFRDEMEHEAQALEEARRADYREFLVDEKPPAPAAGPGGLGADGVGGGARGRDRPFGARGSDAVGFGTRRPFRLARAQRRRARPRPG